MAVPGFLPALKPFQSAVTGLSASIFSVAAVAFARATEKDIRYYPYRMRRWVMFRQLAYMIRFPT